MSSYSFYGSFGSYDGKSNSVNDKFDLKNGSGEESFFKTVDLYLVDKTKPFLKLEASELILTKMNSIILGFQTTGTVFRHNNQNVEVEPIYFKGENSRLEVNEKQLFLNKDVTINMNTSVLDSDKVKITNNGAIIEAEGHVQIKTTDLKTNDKININSDFVLYKTQEEFFEYRQNVKGSITRKRQYEENVSFATDLLTLTGHKGEIDMRGNVSFKKDNLDVFANQGTVFLENYNKKLKYYSLSDDVRLQERLVMDGKPMMRKAFSEKLEGFISEKKIILTGLPKVFQNKDVIKGNRIIIHETIETVEVDDANTSIMIGTQKADKVDQGTQ